ncbi:MAG: PEP-CTERM sorting domain-containing protein [Bryobacteraceae bacterium]
MAMLAFAGSAFGGLIYTTVNSNSLGVINPTTGAGSTIGAFGYSNVTGLAFAPNGTLYTDVNSELATVNLSTGAATPFGATNGDSILAFAANGTLYGTALMGSRLQVLNTTTGVGTNVGTQVLGFSNIMDLAFSPQGVLYAIASLGGTSSYIYQLNTTTGAGTLVATLNVPNLMGLTFDAAGDLYATNYVSNSTLYSVNLTGQSVTAIGSTGIESHGLDMDDFTPEPATWMLLGSGLLMFGGIRRAVRR